MSAQVTGQLATWPSKDRMIAILRAAGLTIRIGQYSIRVDDCSHFVFQEYGGDLGDPSIDADSDTVEDMIREGALVSDALSCAGIKHRFAIYNEHDQLSGYLHHAWPLDENAQPDSCR